MNNAKLQWIPVQLHVPHCVYRLAALKKKKKVCLREPRNAFKSKVLLHPMQIKSFLAAVTGSVTVSRNIFSLFDFAMLFW